MEIIDFSDNKFKDDEQNYYCKHCLEFGFELPLRNRIYPEGEPGPVDKDNWKMCLDCGLIVPIYELEKEAKLKDFVETSESPFDVAKDQFLGVDKRTSKNGIKARKKRERQKQFDWINDEDLKRELKKGSTLLSYSEQLP